MECEFCKKVFKTKGILKNHQNTTKYCLDLRSQINEKYKCQYCFKILTSKHNLENHYDKCINKSVFLEKNLEIEKLKIELNLKNESIEKIKEQYDEQLRKAEQQVSKGQGYREEEEIQWMAFLQIVKGAIFCSFLKKYILVSGDRIKKSKNSCLRCAESKI